MYVDMRCCLKPNAFNWPWRKGKQYKWTPKRGDAVSAEDWYALNHFCADSILWNAINENSESIATLGLNCPGRRGCMLTTILRTPHSAIHVEVLDIMQVYFMECNSILVVRFQR